MFGTIWVSISLAIIIATIKKRLRGSMGTLKLAFFTKRNVAMIIARLILTHIVPNISVEIRKGDAIAAAV
jgi:hypothetical protein